MKLSLKLHDDCNTTQTPTIVKAKIPITIFNQPFVSSLATSTAPTTTTPTAADGTVHQHLSFSLGTNFPSGPSLRLSYTPISTTNLSPFSFSLKSGIGLFGSPNDSPLIFSANFSLSTAKTSTVTPSFFLHFKPQFGNFSLHKTTSSSDPSTRNYGSRSISGAHLGSGSAAYSEFASGSVLNESSGWQELKLETCDGGENGFSNSGPSFFNRVDSIPSDGIGFVKERALGLTDGKKGGFLSGIAVNAKTVLPVTKRVMVNLRWGVNFPENLEVKMPYLTVNKIGIERVEKVEEVKTKNFENDVGDLDLLKGMCFWMRRDLKVLEKENKEMKQYLEDMRMGVSTRSFHGVNDNMGKKAFSFSGESFGDAKSCGGLSDSSNTRKVYPSSSERFGEFESRSKKNGEGNGNGHTEFNKSVNQASDLESELQKAIKAASS